MKKYKVIIFVSSMFFVHQTFGWNIESLRTFRGSRDSLWASVYHVMQLDNKLYGKRNLLAKEEYDILHEYYLRNFRKNGLIYWNNSSKIAQKREWLILTVASAPTYYNYMSQKFDDKEKQQWDSIYISLKKEFISSTDTLPKQKRDVQRSRLKMTELYSDIEYQKFLFQITGKKIDLDNYVPTIIRLATEANSQNRSVMSITEKTSDLIFTDYKNFGLNDTEVISFLTNLDKPKIPGLSEWAQGKKRILELKETPLQLTFKTHDNRLIDISQMKGKVILIDFWATWCSACLEYMPTVKKVFEKYHNNGLEVLSISINKNAEREQVLSVEKKQKVSWPLGIIGDEKLSNEIWKKFAFTSVPQLILLDKNGRLVENNGKLMNEVTLEELVRKAVD